MRYRHSFAEISPKSIEHNANEFLKHVPEDVSLMAVVKADGYGHGAVAAIKAAIKAGAKWAGVALVEEGIALREAGIGEIPILLLGGWNENACSAFDQYKITPIVYSPESLHQLNLYGKKVGKLMPAHLKVDTGMSRLGLSETQLGQFINDFDDYSSIKIEGVLSHFSSADEIDQSFSQLQLEKFQKAVRQLQTRCSPEWIHIANSPGTLQFPNAIGNLFRLGISLYGHPSGKHLKSNLNLQEALQWKSSMIQLQRFPANTPISYNRTYTTTRNSLIATVAVGYGDGYSRSLSNKAHMLVRGKKAPVLGRVCMDMTLIDVTDIKDVNLEDEVVIIGKQGDERITTTNIAEWMGTITYEVLCNISKRIPRIYQNQ